MTTFYVTDECMLLHKCEWDDTHIEVPERLKSVADAIENSGLLTKCTQLESRDATKDELRLVHTDDYVSAIESTHDMLEDDLETFSSRYEDIYVNRHTWSCAVKSAGCALLAAEKVIESKGSNAFAAIRPPGHHAWADQACGFCIFNNVVLCAKAARRKGLERVLIVDFDVHAAQGTQYCIEGDPGIRLVSIHRYEYGNFWPWLPESAAKTQYKNTYNVPLHEIGYGNAEYAAFMNHLVLPLIDDYQPELILVSCGFDAALGDPEGEMRVTPKGFAYMVGSLASLDIPLCVLYEGGYFIEALGYLAVATLDALISKQVPKVGAAIPSGTFLQTLLSTIELHQESSGLFKRWISVVNNIRTANGKGKISKPSEEYKGTRDVAFPYPTRGVYEKRSVELDKAFEKQFRLAVSKENSFISHNSVDVEFRDNELSVVIEDRELRWTLESEEDFALIFYNILLPISVARNFSLNGRPLSAGPARLYSDEINAKQDNVTAKTQGTNGNDPLSECVAQLIHVFEELRPFVE